MKLFNKFISIVTVVAFVLSMMAVPAFAAVAAGVDYVAAAVAKQGDANGDGKVDGTDYDLVVNNYVG